MSNSLSYCAATFDYDCLLVGYSYPFAVKIWDKTTSAYVDISADDFELRVYSATDLITPIATLIVGSGLTIIGTDTLKGLFETPVTDAAGTYTYQLDWTDNASGATIPLNVGKIKVK